MFCALFTIVIFYPNSLANVIKNTLQKSLQRIFNQGSQNRSMRT